MIKRRWILTIDRYGRVTIPAAVRKQLKLVSRTRLTIECTKGVIYLRPLESPR